MNQLEQLQQDQASRTTLWVAACKGEITTHQLYEELAKLRERWGQYLYPERSIQSKYPRR